MQQVSISNKLPETKMKQFREDMDMDNKHLNLKHNVSATKPTRFRLYAEDFYCPMATNICNEDENTLYAKPASPQTLTTSSSTTVSIEDESCQLLTGIPEVGESILSHDSKHVSQETKMTPINEVENDNHNTNSLVDDDHEIDAKVEEVIAADARKLQLGYFCLENINVLPSTVLETRDMDTNTSQPMSTETAVGSSQPGMMEAFTEMSQQKNAGTVECGVQTSQELIYPQSKSSMGNEREMHEEPSRQDFAVSNHPIVFPRVRCQTTGPQIPAKLPRLDQLDKKEVLINPIYSSSVTFQFEDEADKESDRSVLRQRSNMGSVMNKEILYSYSSKTRETTDDDDEKENVPTEDLSLPSSCEFTASRGPFIRVGLSKKSRNYNPLHPRKPFGNAGNN